MPDPIGANIHEVLFVCVHNAARARFRPAVAYFRARSG